MARFTAPEKWNDEWFSNLKPMEKLVFLYLVDRCDNAGFFEINKRIDAFLIGITEEEFMSNLRSIKKTYIPSTDGRKIWLKNYLFYQKNLPLNPDNNAHKQIIAFINSNLKIFNYDFNYLGANEGLFSPLGKGNIIGKDKGNSFEGGMEETLWAKVVQDFHNDFRWIEKFCNVKNVSKIELENLMKDFVLDLELRNEIKDLKQLQSHFTNLFNKNKKNGTTKKQTNGTDYKNTGANAYTDRIGRKLSEIK
jgi:hypothetical protein